jgi:hypothetical protein
MPEREWAVQIDDSEMIGQLRFALNAFDQQGRSVNPKVTNVAPYLVDRFQGLRVEVFSNEHPLLISGSSVAARPRTTRSVTAFNLTVD